MKNLIQSECRLVDNNLLHSDRLAAYEAASDLLANMQDTQEEQISKRIEKKFPGNDSRTQSGTREPRNGNGRSRRQIVDDNSNLNDQGAKYLVFVSSRSDKMTELSFLSLYTF